MRIYLLRHGESEANVAGVISDDPHRPWHLTPKGVDQARAAANALGEVAFSHVYVSEHLRARETAEVLLAVWREKGRAAAACPITTDARLNERHSNLDGRPVEDFNGLVRPDPVNIRPPGGETFREQMLRLRAFLEEASARHGDETVLAVSHENPIQAARAAAGGDPEVAVREAVANCAWMALAWPPEDAQGG